MKAFQITRFGIDNLRIADLSDPEPGPGEVLIRVRATSLNYRDLLLVRGLYDPKLHLPRIPLSDGAGEIVATGAGVTQFRANDRVTGLFLQNWQGGQPSAQKSQGALAGDLDGMLAEYVVLPEHGVIHFPAHLSFEEAATLPCAALTAWNALVEVAAIKAGQTVVVQGTGGVSVFAQQFAKMCGARVFGTSSSDEKLAKAKALGQDTGLNYKQRPEWGSWVKEQTHGEGADVVVEVGGAGTFNESMRAVRVGGTITQIGVLSSSQERISVLPILMHQIRIAGIYVGSREMYQRMNRAIELHQMRPVVGKVFPFVDTPAAYQYLESGSHFGKIVITLP